MVKVLGLATLLAVGRAVTDVETAFEKFVRDFDRHYSSEHEKRTRFAVFKENYALVQAENAKGNSYTLGINGFADQTPEEFQGTHLGLSQSAPSWEGLPHLGTHKYSGVELPASVDWTQKGAVTPVKNQQQCGSCWAFSTTGAVEGAWQIASGKLVSLSEQQLVDCDHDSAGCGGGNMESSFTFLGKNNICTEESYPYEAKNGKCRESNCTTGIPKGSIVGFKDVSEGDDNALMEAVSQQPVSVAIEADQAAFQLYKGGVLTKKCGDKLDHGVLLVGYGTEGGVDFWKVKNSWGPSWGEQGYVRLERGLKGKGECGIKADPSYPIMKKQMDLVV